MITFIIILLILIPMGFIVGINEQEQDFLIKTHQYISDKYEQEFYFQSSYINELGNLVVKFETDETEGIDEWVEVVRYVNEDGSINYIDNFPVQILCDNMRLHLYSEESISQYNPILYIHRPSIQDISTLDYSFTFDDVKLLESSHIEMSMFVIEDNFKKQDDILNFYEKVANYLSANYREVTLHVYIISNDVCNIIVNKGIPYFYKYAEKYYIPVHDITIMNGVIV